MSTTIVMLALLVPSVSPIPQLAADELREMLRTRDLQFDNALLEFEMTSRNTRRSRTKEFPYELPFNVKSEAVAYPPVVIYKHDYRLIVRGPYVMISKQLLESNVADATRMLRRSEQISNLKGNTWFVEPPPPTDRKSPTLVSIYPGGDPVDTLHEFRMLIEFGFGIGFGKRLKEIKSVHYNDTYCVLDGTIQIWWDDVSTCRLELDEQFLVRNAVIECDVKGFRTRFVIKTSGVADGHAEIVLAKEGDLKQWQLNHISSKQVIEILSRDLSVRQPVYQGNLTDEQYDRMTELQIPVDAHVIDHRPKPAREKPPAYMSPENVSERTRYISNFWLIVINFGFVSVLVVAYRKKLLSWFARVQRFCK